MENQAKKVEDRKTPLDIFTLKYTAAVAHTFIIHGNYADYATINGGGAWISVKDTLAKTVAGRQTQGEKQIVVLYNRAEGIKFLLSTMRDDLMAFLNEHHYPVQLDPNHLPIAPEDGVFQIFDFML